MSSIWRAAEAAAASKACGSTKISAATRSPCSQPYRRPPSPSASAPRSSTCTPAQRFRSPWRRRPSTSFSQGRARLGLSVGHHPWNDLAHGIPLEAPLARLREYVQFIRKALSGKQFTHNGRFFSGVNSRLGVSQPRPDLPIYIGATRPRMVALAGEVADGLLTNVVSPYYIANFTAQQFHDAAHKAGRDPNQLELTAIATAAPMTIAQPPSVMPALPLCNAFVAIRTE